jgi:hypothetical protein
MSRYVERSERFPSYICQGCMVPNHSPADCTESHCDCQCQVDALDDFQRDHVPGILRGSDPEVIAYDEPVTGYHERQVNRLLAERLHAREDFQRRHGPRRNPATYRARKGVGRFYTGWSAGSTLRNLFQILRGGS